MGKAKKKNERSAGAQGNWGNERVKKRKNNANEGKDHVVQSGGAIHTVRRPDPTPDTNCDGPENMTAFFANIV